MFVYIDEWVKACYGKIIAAYFENYTKKTDTLRGQNGWVFNAGVLGIRSKHSDTKG
jgi:predicted PolB exonuclease-like 3'-5' exonuclease